MLLDPLEEQLDLPSALVEGADGRGRQTELIGEEHQGFSRLGIAQPDAPQVLGVMLAGVVTASAMVCSQMIPVARSVGAE